MKCFAIIIIGKVLLSLVGVMALALIEGQAAAQCELELFASDDLGGENFGYSISISGTPGNKIAIIGARRDDDLGLDSGSAYIYRYNGTIWVEEQKLLASDGAQGDQFGFSVSISGTPGNEVAIIGARHDEDNGGNSGSAYVFRYNGAIWIEEPKLLASDGAADDAFGTSVSISGEVAVVGTLKGDGLVVDSGSAYIYRYNGAIWVEGPKLIATDGATDDNFGRSVSLFSEPGNEFAIVGAGNDDDNGTDSGSAYIYRYDPGLPGWTEEDKLLASNGATGDTFGISVSISSDTAVVGAWSGDGLVADSGSAYIYRYDPGLSLWPEEDKLLASDGAMFDFFGWSVAINGTSGNEIAIVGAFFHDDNGTHSGSAYIYRFNGVSWVEEQKLLASDGVAGDRFGWSVSISSDPGNELALVGAESGDGNDTNTGSAYVIELTVCPADTNCSGQINVTDLLTLLGSWGPCPAPCVADSNSDGNVNVTDLLALLGAWGPCP